MGKGRLFARAFIIFGLLLAVALVASPAMAASDQSLTIKTMKVSVQPEYDDPRVMVTYEGEFKDGSVFPQPVKFPVPLGSVMGMVCALKPPNDEHLCQLYDTLTAADALSISYTLPISTYYLEYYWDGLKAQSDNKSLMFKYVSPYAIDTLDLEVQQPLRATDFQLTQPYASVTSDGLGMKYYHYTFNNVTPGQVIGIGASYTKPDSKPSVAKKQTTGAGATGPAGPGTYNVIWWTIAVLAVVVVGFFGFRSKRKPARVYNTRVAQSRKAAGIQARRAEPERARNQNAHKPARPAPMTRGAAVVAPDRQGTGAAFCSKCGVRLPTEAHFCHVCGAKTVEAD